jgi:DNA-binding transcriptional ArsR family regulator
MTEQTHHEELLDFFKALADANRLKIVGFLAQRPYTVEELAEALGLSVSTTSHHLSYLHRTGLVSARSSGHYAIYSLEIQALQEKARHLLQPETLASLSQPVADSLPAYDRKVLSTFLDAEGRIIAFPAQEKKYQVLLRHVAQVFEPDVRYAEKQVNEILSRFNDDTASLRRGLIEYNFMQREGGGGAYWRSSEPKA